MKYCTEHLQYFSPGHGECCSDCEKHLYEKIEEEDIKEVISTRDIGVVEGGL